MAKIENPQDMSVYPVAMAVTSESDPGATYMVQLPYCPCKDFRFRRGIDAAGNVYMCKHLRQAAERAGGWHREPEPGPVVHTGLTRSAAFTLLTSHYIAATLAENLLSAATATASEGLAATADITNGSLSVKLDKPARRYTVTIPASQPGVMPG